MPLSSLPDECFINILTFLDNKSIYRCLFVSRYYCKLSIPTIWRDPFTKLINDDNTSLISILLSCLNEDEISSLIPCAINLNFNNQPPLFEYGNFIRTIDHGYCIDHIVTWLNSPSKRVSNILDQDCRVQRLIHAIYHMIMRKGSNLQEFVLYSDPYYYIDLPKFSIFTTYKPGITNLRFLCIHDNTTNDVKYQNTSEFLSMVSKFCNGIINCELWASVFDSVFSNQILDIIRLQPLKSLLLYGEHADIKKILYTLEEFRSETLKELSFHDIDFRNIDLSFMSKLKCLERLEFVNGFGFTFNVKKKLYLKELKLWNCDSAASIINFFCSEALLKLSFNIVTPEIVKTIKETCPNVNFLRIALSQNDSLTLIPLICELPSLKTLNIKLNRIDEGPLIKLLSNHLFSIEHLFLDFNVSLENFEYFTNNFKANLKRLDTVINMSDYDRKDYLIYVNDFQKIHNSLKIFGIKKHYGWKFSWSDEEIEIVNLLKNQGIDVVFFDE